MASNAVASTRPPTDALPSVWTTDAPVPRVRHLHGALREARPGRLVGVALNRPAGEPVRGREPPAGAAEHPARPSRIRRPDGATGRGPLLCASRLVTERGIDTLIAAFGLLADDRPALNLEVIGGGPLDALLIGRARALDLADRVHVRGPLPSGDVLAALHRCAMVVLPCPVEEPGDPYGLPAVLLGAMACGTPVVTTDTTGLPELVRHDATGVLVAPDEPAGLAAAIAALLDDPVRAANVGAAGRLLVERLHERDRNAVRLQRIWREIGR
jgi:glycosyltransferase involved in cell wall biosynthesis